MSVMLLFDAFAIVIGDYLGPGLSDDTIVLWSRLTVRDRL
jgi:hypothetical protein